MLCGGACGYDRQTLSRCVEAYWSAWQNWDGISHQLGGLEALVRGESQQTQKKRNRRDTSTENFWNIRQDGHYFFQLLKELSKLLLQRRGREKTALGTCNSKKAPGATPEVWLSMLVGRDIDNWKLICLRAQKRLPWEDQLNQEENAGFWAHIIS